MNLGSLKEQEYSLYIFKIYYVYSILPARMPAHQKRAPDVIIDEPPCIFLGTEQETYRTADIVLNL